MTTCRETDAGGCLRSSFDTKAGRALEAYELAWAHVDRLTDEANVLGWTDGKTDAVDDARRVRAAAREALLVAMSPGGGCSPGKQREGGGQ